MNELSIFDRETENTTTIPITVVLGQAYARRRDMDEALSRLGLSRNESLLVPISISPGQGFRMITVFDGKSAYATILTYLNGSEKKDQ